MRIHRRASRSPGSIECRHSKPNSLAHLGCHDQLDGGAHHVGLFLLPPLFPFGTDDATLRLQIAAAEYVRKVILRPLDAARLSRDLLPPGRNAKARYRIFCASGREPPLPPIPKFLPTITRSRKSNFKGEQRPFRLADDLASDAVGEVKMASALREPAQKRFRNEGVTAGMSTRPVFDRWHR